MIRRTVPYSAALFCLLLISGISGSSKQGAEALKVDQTNVRMPMGATRSVKVVGSAASRAKIDCSDTKVAKVVRSADGFTIQSLSLGQADIILSAGDNFQTVHVQVQPYAAHFPQNFSATVTGVPATAETVSGAISTVVRGELVVAPAASIKLDFPSTTSILPGASKTFSVHVHTSGPDLFPAEGTVSVHVNNMALPKMPDAELWYCNDPETIRQPGLLFAAPLRPDIPARLLYHHVNFSPSPMIIRVEAINNSDKAAQIMIIPGDSDPTKNSVMAGMRAGTQYLSGWALGSGEVVSIPPHFSLPISLRRIAHGQTMSGLCSLRLLDGGPEELLVRADARLPYGPDARWQTALDSSTPWRQVGAQRSNLIDRDAVAPSPHIYPIPYKEARLDYTVGGKYGYYRLGDFAIERADRRKQLDGNFGVIYQLDTKLTNPTKLPIEVDLIFEASAGYSGAVFEVSGEMVATPLLLPKQEARVARFHVDPGITRNVSIVTLPLSGSSYPATITLRPSHPLGNG